MFGKKKSQKPKEENSVKPSSKDAKKSDKKKDSHKVDKKKSVDKERKDKRGSGEAEPGYSWVQVDSSSSSNSSSGKQKSVKVDGSKHSKYSPQNLNLVKASSLYDAKKPDRKPDKKKDKEKKVVSGSNGILKSKLPPNNHGQPAALYKLPAHSQVTFAGQDNRVHQSVVNVSNSPVVKPKSSSFPNSDGYISGSSEPGTVFQNKLPGTRNRYHQVHPFFQRTDTYSPPVMTDPKEIVSEHVNHYCISHGQETKHVTSINVNSKTSVELPDKLPVVKQNSNSSTSSESKHVSQIAPQMQSVQSTAEQKCSSCRAQQQAVMAAQPVVLAEVNIPSRIVSPKEPIPKYIHSTQPSQTNRSSGEVKYAELSFIKKAEAFNDDKPIRRSASSTSLEKTEGKQTIKGILKPPAPIKRVEFNNEVDINLFNTLSSLSSRHQSLESLSIFDEDTLARDHHMMRDRRERPPPLDDTDLYMYTLKRNRMSPAGRAVNGTVSYRQRPSQPPSYWRQDPWGSAATARYHNPFLRTVRMVPPAGGSRRNDWMW